MCLLEETVYGARTYEHPIDENQTTGATWEFFLDS